MNTIMPRKTIMSTTISIKPSPKWGARAVPGVLYFELHKRKCPKLKDPFHRIIFYLFPILNFFSKLNFNYFLFPKIFRNLRNKLIKSRYKVNAPIIADFFFSSDSSLPKTTNFFIS